MTSNITQPGSKQPEATASAQLFDDWYDPIEAGVRAREHDFIQDLIEAEVEAALSRRRFVRRGLSCRALPAEVADGDSTSGATAAPTKPRAHGHRHGHCSRALMGTFGEAEISVLRARIEGADGKTTEWYSKALRKYRQRTKAADALIASTYLSGTNTRRVRHALATLFRGAVSKDTVSCASSCVWRKVTSDWKAWN